MDYDGRSYADLPMEVILHIMKYLNGSDILEASLSCRQWFNALSHRKFMSRIQIHFNQLQLTDIHSPPLNVFANSMRHYSKIQLNHVDLDQGSLCLWHRFGKNLTHIEFNSCDLSENTFTAILKVLNNLESISVKNCREIFMTGNLFRNPNDQTAVRMACRTVKSLSLSNNRYISDALFNRFTGVMENIQRLNLSGCYIAFHSALYRKFYPKHQHEASSNIFTFFLIMQFIESHAQTLKYLDFSETLIDGNALSQLAEVKNLQLHGLQLRSCDQLTNSGISKLVSNQRLITEIDVSLSVRLTDFSLLDICRTLSHLKVLKMRRCRAITDQVLKSVHQLKHLECLDISECDAITSEGFIEGIANQTNDTMVELYVSALNICELSVIKLAQSLKNLRLLDLSFCKNAVTNLAVQFIFNHLTMLRTLNLEFCDMISDAGITGRGMSSKMEKFEEILTNRNPHHISLRSKAEEEIVHDSKRKMHLFDNGEIDCSSYTISQLKGLRSLNLASCNHVTDVSLKYAFDLPELETLSLSKCQQISVMGLECASMKCPSIKVLNLSDCHNLCDRSIDIVVRRFKRLAYLHIERCNQLTNVSLESIAMHCKHLKYLDVRGCRVMCELVEPSSRLRGVRSLQQILVSKPGPYIADNGKQLVPTPPLPF